MGQETHSDPCNSGFGRWRRLAPRECRYAPPQRYKRATGSRPGAAAMMDAIQKAAQALAELSDEEWLRVKCDEERRRVRALDDFVIDADGETATVRGDMEVVLVRPVGDGGARLWLTIKFPSGETLDVRIARAQLLSQLGIKTDES